MRLRITAFDEREGTTSKISNSKEIESVAVFLRNDDNFVPNEKTKRLLSEFEKAH